MKDDASAERIIYNNNCPELLPTTILMRLSESYPYGDWPCKRTVSLALFKMPEGRHVILSGRRIKNGAAYYANSPGNCDD